MTEPLVCCICLTKDRPAMTRRAVESFRRQTYANKRLLIYSAGALEVDRRSNEFMIGQECATRPIGQLRNEANEWACGEAAVPNVLCHWDSDDWSHPNRIAEHVALLQASGAECVGYNEVLFWDTRQELLDAAAPWTPKSKAYIYRNYSPDYCIGSSMMYWRSAWERVKFDHINHGEDERFLRRVKSVGVSAFIAGAAFQPNECRMICSIHSSNSSHYDPERERNTYTRAPQWDAYCAREMEIK